MAPGKIFAKRWGWAAAAIVIIAVAGTVYWWRFAPIGGKPLSSFPENISTRDMKAGELASFVIGLQIRGRRATDEQPFTVTVNPDNTALYEFERLGAQAGTYQKTVGKWWVSDYRFCMRIKGFAFGAPACPVIAKHGATLTATRPTNGRPLPWTISK
jgi:hypothetical protein